MNKSQDAQSNIDARNAQIGVIGDNAKIEGGIHFHTPTTTAERRAYKKHLQNRQNVIANVRFSWIDNVLDRALHETVKIILKLEHQPTALTRHLHRWEGQPNDSPIPEGYDYPSAF